ncbi:MAG TPA: hypothetical protein VFC44_08535 [Candidatus Saccharimonadales bacterium]|nr:hypothetical protein [Candidatus Saccharimonadales bacterium]
MCFCDQNRFFSPAALCALLAALILPLDYKGNAEPIYIPNASFELPVTDFVATNMVSWETVPPLPQETQGAIGVFYNNPLYGPGGYIVNADGNQAAYIFAETGLAMFQDYNSQDSSQTAPSHAFNAKFEVGRSYKLVAGLIGGDQGAAPGVVLQMSAYYRDASNNMVTVAFTNIVYTTNLFPSATNFVDCELDVPPVSASNAWAGQNIGIQFLSIVPTNVSAGGDWDVDNVRLSSSLYVPNASFELPVTDFVATNMVSWETVPPLPQETQGAIGVFYNNPLYGAGGYIVNADGNQAAYIFADTGLAMFQDYNSQDSSQTAPSHAFNAKFEVGRSYKLVAGLIGGDQGAAPGVILQMSVYYRDGSNNMVTVAFTNIVYTTNLFPSATNFVDCELDVPPVSARNGWAGQNIGIQFLSIVPTNVSAGGDWDVDNVRLSEALAPAWINPAVTNGQFTATLQSDPGLAFQILATTNLSAAVSNWTNVATLTNVSGMISFVDATTNSSRRFYIARQVPHP